MPAINTRTGGEVVVRALVEAGVHTVFGVPGESFLGILDALYDAPIRFISTRHEGGASFMASGYSKISGEAGVCLGTRAVGLSNMLIGIHNARQDSTPMLAIVGQVQRSVLGREAFQELDVVAATLPYAKAALQIPSADRAAELMIKALLLATSGRPGPVVVAVPQDVCDEPTSVTSVRIRRPPAIPPDRAALAAILDALLAARRPLIFAGGGLYHASDGYSLLVEFAEAAELPVITSWRHHDGFPNDHRLFLGSASLGTAPAVWQRIEQADAILVLGNRLQENSTRGYQLPRPDTRLFHIDIDPAAAPAYRDAEIVIQADAAAALRALLELWPRPNPSSRRRAENDADRRAFEQQTTLALPDRTPKGVRYQSVVQTLLDELPPAAIVATDGGNFYAWLSRFYRFRAPHTYVGPASGAMGYGLPGGIGAQLARPETPVVTISGDGGFLMTMQELETAVRYQLPVVAIVLDNQRHGTIRMHQEREHPGRVIGTELGTPDLALVAAAYGARGWSIDDEADFAPALREALVGGTPAVLHVAMDRSQLSVDTRLPSEST